MGKLEKFFAVGQFLYITILYVISMKPNYIALTVCHAGVPENATAGSVTTFNSNIEVSHGTLS